MAKASAWHEARDHAIVTLLQEGQTPETVAARYDLCVTRVRQIYRQAVPDGPLPWVGALPKQVKTPEVARSCLARWDAGESVSRIARDYDVSPATVHQWLAPFRYQRAEEASARAWREPLSDSERYAVAGMLWDAWRARDWEQVERARVVLAERSWQAFDQAHRRPAPDAVGGDGGAACDAGDVVLRESD